MPLLSEAVVFAPCQKEHCAADDQGHCHPDRCNRYRGEGPEMKRFVVEVLVVSYYDGAFVASVVRNCQASNEESALQLALNSVYRDYSDFVWEESELGHGSQLFLVFKGHTHYAVRGYSAEAACKAVGAPKGAFCSLITITAKSSTE